MTAKNGDIPAMPLPLGDETAAGCDGLTKREMMAMHMMAANRSRGSNYRSWEGMAKDAIEMADALLAELERMK